MGNENATLLFAVPNTNWVNATFSWVTAERSISRVTAERSTQPNPAPGWSVSRVMQRVASFLLPGESYLSLILKRLRATR